MFPLHHCNFCRRWVPPVCNAFVCLLQYFLSVISSLVAVAWIGQQVHNLFLTYLIGKLHDSHV